MPFINLNKSPDFIRQAADFMPDLAEDLGFEPAEVKASEK